jgi:putative ATP-dependent endonuclease of OLD family
VALHISRIEIKNFRNFLDFKAENLAPSMVVVGENESGKTNLLRALRLILDPELPSSQRKLREEDFCELSDGPNGSTEISVAVDLIGFDGNPKVEAILSDYYVLREPLTARLNYRFASDLVVHTEEEDEEDTDGAPDPDGESEADDASRPTEAPESEARPKSITVADYEWTIYGGTDSTRLIGPAELQRIALQLVDALRDAENELAVGRRRNPLRELLEDLEPDPDKIEQVTNALQEASDDLLKDPVVGSTEKLIADELNRLSGEALGLSPSLGLAPADPNKLLRQARLFLDREKTRGVGDVSLGVSNIAYLALLLKTLERRRERRGREISILAIEEPEAHLHPQIQRRLFRTLLSEEDGLVVTTHSPHLAAVTPIDRLVLLRRDQSGSTAATISGAGLTDRQKSDIQRYLNVTRAELLFARCVIFVEGDAELHLLPAMAQQGGLDLDELGISVVSVQGTDFLPYLKLVSADALRIPHVVLTDGDRDVQAESAAASPGLLRAQRYSQLESQTLKDAKTEKRKLSADEQRQLRIDLCKQGYYVGNFTLEIDLIRLYPQTAISAADELWTKQSLKQRFEEVCWKIASDSETSEDRDWLLARIERIGKGRFAQRWAAHIELANARTAATERKARTGKDEKHLVDLPAGVIIAALRASKDMARRSLEAGTK